MEQPQDIPRERKPRKPQPEIRCETCNAVQLTKRNKPRHYGLEPGWTKGGKSEKFPLHPYGRAYYCPAHRLSPRADQPNPPQPLGQEP